MSIRGIALLFIIGIIILNLIGLRVYRNEINDHLKKSMIKEEIALGSLSQLIQEKVYQKFDPELGKSINDYLVLKQLHEDRIDELELELNALFGSREENYKNYKCQCDGTCGSGKRGRGSECERMEKKYLQSNREYQELKVQFDSIKNSSEILNQKKKIQKDIEVFLDNKIESSYLERIQALWQVIFLGK